MNLIATMACRNEAWIVACSLRIVLRWADAAVVLLHCCTDATADIVMEIAEEHPGRVHILVEDSPDWSEMNHRQRMLVEARRHGATHIAITDADEILSGNLLGTVRDQIACLPAGGFAHFGMPCIWRGLDRYRVDGRIWANRYDICLAFADRHDLHWAQTAGYDHHHREPHGARVAFRAYGQNGGAMHLQWASWRRLIHKQNHYRMMEALKYPNKSIYEINYTYGFAVDEAGLTLAPTPAEWWEPYKDLMQLIDLEAPSWHEQECERLIAAHGAERFRGLHLASLEVAA